MDSYVLLFPEGMIKLNPSAAEVLQLCDGNLDTEGLIAALQDKFPGAELADDVHEFVAHASEKGWLVSG